MIRTGFLAFFLLGFIAGIGVDQVAAVVNPCYNFSCGWRPDHPMPRHWHYRRNGGIVSNGGEP